MISGRRRLIVAVVAAGTIVTGALAYVSLRYGSVPRYEIAALRDAGAIPVAVAIDARRARLYVVGHMSTSGRSVVAAIDVRQGSQLYAVELGGRATAIEIDEHRRRLLVTSDAGAQGSLSLERGRLTVLDAESGRVLLTAETGSDPIAVLLDQSGQEILVLNRASPTVPGTLTIFDGDAKVITELRLGIYPSSIASDRAQAAVFVGNFLSNTITIVDVAARRIDRTVTLGPAPGTLARVAFDAESRQLLALSYPPRYSRDQPTDGELRVMDTRTFDTSARVTIPNPTQMQLSVSTRQVLVASSLENANRLTALSLPSAAVMWTTDLEDRAETFAVDGAGQRVYVAGSRKATISVIDAKTGRGVCARSLDDVPRFLAVDELAHRAFVVTSAGRLVRIDANC